VSGILVLAYTTIGGVLGAGLTQYVTHVRDRRTARAQVVERLTQAEEVYASLREPLPGDEQSSSRSRMVVPLGSLEAAGLIAGVPRTILSRYIRSCRIYEDSHRMLDGTQLFVDQLARTVSGQADKIRESGNVESVQASLQVIIKNVGDIGIRVDKIDDPAFRLHDAALEELGLALWHPVKLQLRRRKLRATQRLAETIEKMSQDLTGSVRSIDVLCKTVSARNFQFKAAAAENDASSVAGQGASHP
jgi:hypothetical protein